MSAAHFQGDHADGNGRRSTRALWPDQGDREEDIRGIGLIDGELELVAVLSDLEDLIGDHPRAFDRDERRGNLGEGGGDQHVRCVTGGVAFMVGDEGDFPGRGRSPDPPTLTGNPYGRLATRFPSGGVAPGGADAVRPAGCGLETEADGAVIGSHASALVDECLLFFPGDASLLVDRLLPGDPFNRQIDGLTRERLPSPVDGGGFHFSRLAGPQGIDSRNDAIVERGRVQVRTAGCGDG